MLPAGVSNCVVGALGAGYTGSFIFSQTVFTKRAGVYSRVNGFTLSLAELLVFALPFSVVQVCEAISYNDYTQPRAYANQQAHHVVYPALSLCCVHVFTVASRAQYCPSFFYGSLLLWFGIEITRDWLVLSFRKLSIQEYLLLW